MPNTHTLQAQSVYSNQHMKTVKLECSSNSKYFYDNHSCRLKAVNRFKSVGMMHFYPRDPLHSISFNMALYMRNDANIFKPHIVNITVNLCNNYDSRSSGIYKAVVMKVLKQFTNLNHSCPYEGALVAKNLYLDANLIPIRMAKKSYMAKLLFYKGIRKVVDPLMTVKLYMDLIESNH
ncbi:uncharacterized protein LOC135961425 [Calliphora vicina]|uniref:uncharacterized protein LOC135961425 n=1 Tax=Calliphora vicina TaxID=7373 RepID=UPI00325A90E6